MNLNMLEGLWFMCIGALIGMLIDRLLWLTWIIKNKIKLIEGKK